MIYKTMVRKKKIDRKIRAKWSLRLRQAKIA